ncbi:MAG: class I SAM-dependent methyltransferase [Chloroflexia bacterium]
MFDEVWKESRFFYWPGDVRGCRTFPELWEAVKFRRLEEFFPHTPQRSLEVGCGSGGVSLYFHDRYGYQVTLVDISEVALAFARENFARHSTAPERPARFLQADACALPFPTATFDLVMSFGLLEHFADIEPPIAEQLRVLRPGGIFFADIVPRRFSVDSFSRFPGRVKHCFAARFRGRRPARPIYENALPLSRYIAAVERYGGQVRWARGNRPVTSLNLPLLGRFALRLYQTEAVQRFWRRFDLSDSPLARFWGAGWWVLAEKLEGRGYRAPHPCGSDGQPGGP